MVTNADRMLPIVVAVLFGVAISALADLPAGPVLVFSFALVAILVRLILRAQQRATQA